MLSALALSSTIAASTPSSPATATKLAEAIASSRGSTAAKVYVGALPPGISTPAPLPKFTLLGSVVTMPATLEIYYEASVGGMEQSLQEYRKQLQAAGWKASAFMQRFMQVESPGGGFVVAQVAPEAPDLYCRTGGFIAFKRLRSMPDTVALSFGSGPQVNALCTLSAVMAAMPTPAPPPALPTLRAPSGVTLEPMESGRFTSHILESGSAESDAAVKSSLPLPQIGAAFAQQLGSAQTFHMTSKGHRLHAVLSLFATGKERQYDAVLRAVDLDAAPAPSTGFSFPFFR